MDFRMLVKYCSPTLAGIKTAGLFNYIYQSENELFSSVNKLNSIFYNTGISVEILKYKDNFALIYVYRRKMLERDLQKNNVINFLSQYGYNEKNFNYTYALSVLKSKIQNDKYFPHEIGLFLGYPLYDVIGFIENKGQKSKLTGVWKVYHNEDEAINIFNEFKKCQDTYLKLYDKGESIMRLIVVA